VMPHRPESRYEKVNVLGAPPRLRESKGRH